MAGADTSVAVAIARKLFSVLNSQLLRPFGMPSHPATSMADEVKLKEMQKNRRLSLQHLRRGAILFGVTGVALLVVQQFISMRLWIPFIVLGILSLTVIGDLISYIYCGRQIRKMQHD